MTDVSEIQGLVDQYRVWLRDRTSLRAVHADWVEITTPFIDRHNDYIQLYAKAENGGYRLTDDGHTIRDLEISGCLLNSPKRRGLLRVTVGGLSVEDRDGTLTVLATPENFPARKHALIQAILAVNDMFYTASPNVHNLFREDVAQWLDLNEVRYIPRIQFSGKSGYVHQFDFGIPRSRTEPERIVKTINNPNKDTAQSLIFSWLDTREERPSDSVALAVLNDNERAVSGGVLDALHQYEIEPVLWSHKEQSRDRLAA